MTDEEAMSFLKQHQPLADDEQLTEDVVREYEEVREHFVRSPNPQAISLFLNSFGKGDGFGVYQLVEDVLAQFAQEEVVPHLVDSLKSANPGVVYWTTQIAANYDDERLVRPLLDLLSVSSTDMRMAAVTALEKYKLDDVRNEVRARLSSEENNEIRQILMDMLT